METMAAPPELSIVLPCYNEAAGLEALLKRFAVAGAGAAYELILVDNGSTDATRQLLPKLLPRFSFARSVRVEHNQGYGHGILIGLRAAKGGVLAWSHADLQTDPADIFRAWNVYRQSDRRERMLVKGRRHGRSLQERIVSLGMQTVATVLLRTRFDEINAQPKLFHRDLLVCLTNPPIDLNLDLYAVYTARRSGWRVRSIPVAFPPRQHGQSSWATTWRSKVRTISRSVRYMVRLALEKPPRLIPESTPAKTQTPPAEARRSAA
jgi:glycosyltransferase involved in cell wall biosynthesis